MRLPIFAIALCAAVAGCGAFDSRIEWRDGPYILLWIDIPSATRLSYDLGQGSSSGRIDEIVFSVGSNERYVVAKQHPDGDRNVTNYFYINKANDRPYADPRSVVVGPLSEEEFRAKASELGLPAFSKTLASLE